MTTPYDPRRLGADRPPFRVGESVIVILREMTYWQAPGQPFNQSGTPPPGATITTNYDTYVAIENPHSGYKYVCLDALVLTTPAPVGKGWNDAQPGYAVMVTLPDGSQKALQVQKDSIWRVADRPLIDGILDAQRTYTVLASKKATEHDAAAAAINTKWDPSLQVAQAEHQKAVAALRAAAMSKPQGPRKHVFQPGIHTKRCERRQCGLPETDPIHKR